MEEETPAALAARAQLWRVRLWLEANMPYIFGQTLDTITKKITLELHSSLDRGLVIQSDSSNNFNNCLLKQIKTREEPHVTEKNEGIKSA